MTNGKRCLWTPCEYLGPKRVSMEKACWKIVYGVNYNFYRVNT